MADLTNKQKRFVEEYIIDLNATQAAIRAGYSEHSANQIGSDTLAKVYVQEAVREAMVERSRRTGITADRVLSEIAKLAFSNMENYMKFDKDGKLEFNFTDISSDQAAAISELTVDTRHERDQEGDKPAQVIKVRFELADKFRNLELLGRHLKLFTDKVDVNATGNFVLNISEVDARGL